MLELTSPASRVVALAASAAVHLGVVAAMGGDGASGPRDAAAREVPAPALEMPAEPSAAAVQEERAQHTPELAPPTRARVDGAPHIWSAGHAVPAHTPVDAVALAPTLAEDAPAPRFVMVVGRGVTPKSNALAEPSTNVLSSDAETVAEDVADARPRLVSGAAPPYPAAAAAAGVEADVPVAILVGVDGSVEEAEAHGHVGYGLEEAATRAVRSYRFTRASRRGRPVRVRMTWTVLFRLH